MTSRLTFLDHQLVVFKPYFHWADIKRFVMEPQATDMDLLAALVENAHYRDHYAGQDAQQQDNHSLHGPYDVTAISAGVFERVSPEQARGQLREWLARWLDGESERGDVLTQFNDDVLPHPNGEVVYRLPDLRETAEHEWGWVVGQDGFHEFVCMDRPNRLLTLLVASDD